MNHSPKERGTVATVDAVIATKAAIIPAAVGVDIGCGMNAVRTGLTAEQLPDGLYKLRTDIESVVPAGLLQHSMSKAQGSAAHRAGGRWTVGLIASWRSIRR